MIGIAVSANGQATVRVQQAQWHRSLFGHITSGSGYANLVEGSSVKTFKAIEFSFSGCISIPVDTHGAGYPAKWEGSDTIRVLVPRIESSMMDPCILKVKVHPDYRYVRRDGRLIPLTQGGEIATN